MDYALSFIKPGDVCCEIGVWKGDFTSKILDRFPSRVIAIDPFLYQPEFSHRRYGTQEMTQQRMDSICKKYVRKFVDTGQVKLLREKSNEACRSIGDGVFDWVYIDGNHEYETVFEDINIYWDKIKFGGFLTGDDWNWRNPRGVKTVQKAVKYFCSQHSKKHLNFRVQGRKWVIRK